MVSVACWQALTALRRRWGFLLSALEMEAQKISTVKINRWG